jgi:hypothetical protein
LLKAHGGFQEGEEHKAFVCGNFFEELALPSQRLDIFWMYQSIFWLFDHIFFPFTPLD